MSRPSRDGDAARLLGMDRLGARVVAGVFGMIQLILVVTAGGPQTATWQGLLAVLLILAALAALVSRGADPLPLPRTLAIVAVVPVSLALDLPLLSTTGWPGYSGWFVGADAVLMIGLALRGRTGVAVGGMAVLIAMVVGWSLLTGQGLAHGLLLIGRESGEFVIGAAFAGLFRQTTRRIREVSALRARQVAEEELVAAAAHERRQRTSALIDEVGPALAEIAAGTTDAARRIEYSVLEASLRDAIRARAFLAEPLTSAVIEARRRGVEIVLLDDTADIGLTDAQRAELVAWTTEHLRATAGRAFRARLHLEANRPTVSTVTDEGVEESRVLGDAPSTEGSRGRHDPARSHPS